MTSAHTRTLNIRESGVGHDPIGPDRAIADALDDLLSDDRDRHGRVILAYAPEKRLISDFRVRLARLQAGLIPAQPSDLVPLLAQMFLGFGASRVSESDAQTHVTQYVAVLAHLPLWAVQRACRRFASGNVTRAECPDWKRAYAPSTAQLCQLAEASVRDYWREQLRINAALNGTPAYQPPKRGARTRQRRFRRAHCQNHPKTGATFRVVTTTRRIGLLCTKTCNMRARRVGPRCTRWISSAVWSGDVVAIYRRQ